MLPLRKLRRRLGLLAVNKWPLKALLRLMRPLPVILNRLAAARLVFILLPIGTLPLCLSLEDKPFPWTGWPLVLPA